MLETVDLDGKIGHLFANNISLNYAHTDSKTLKYNEICCPIFEKTIDASERSVFQLSETLRKNGLNSNPRNYLCTKNKTHATMLEKA